MKTKVLMLLAAGMLVACTQQPQPVSPFEVADQAQPVETQACPAEGFYSPLPVDIRLAFPFHLRSDRIFTNKKGKLRRRVTMELLEGQAGAAFESASQSLVAGGYKPKGVAKGDLTARSSQTFTQKGKPSIVLVSNVNVGAKPANPDALGLVSLEWTPPRAKQTAVE